MRPYASQHKMTLIPHSPVTRPVLPNSRVCQALSRRHTGTAAAKAARRATSKVGASARKRSTHPTRQFQNPKSEFRNSAERRGSVLIVVIGLLLLMMLVGITFFTFSNQEHNSATFYADSAKVFSVPLDNAIFDMALEQLIIGPHDDNTQSVLTPGKYSLVPNELGMFGPNPDPVNGTHRSTVPLDRHSFNGGFGIHIISGATGQPLLDQNFNGIDDATEDLNMNGIPDGKEPGYLDLVRTVNLSGAVQLSAFGNPKANGRQAIFNNFPAIDVGYTYPDINNLFLAYIGTTSVPSTTPGGAPTVYQVVIPSFIRPALLRDAAGNPNKNWQTDPTLGPQLLRPHMSHVCVANPSTPRYLTSAKLVPNSNPPHFVQPFGKTLGFQTGPSPNGLSGDMGIWSNSFGAGAVLGWDVDNDGDGIAEGIWLDLGLPATILLDGTVSVPLVSFTVVEADSLINLNAAGNISGFLSLSHPLSGRTVTGMTSGNTPLSRSNLGLSPAEINPLWGLTSNPFNSATVPLSKLQQYRGFYGVTNPTGYKVDPVEMANMDMLFIFWGRPNYTVTPGAGGTDVFTLTDLTAGLWGELGALFTGCNSGVPSDFPRPGQSNVDDNSNQYVQVNETDPIQKNSLLLAPGFQPLDYFGVGSWLMDLGGTSKGLVPNLTYPLNDSASPARFLQYTNYQSQASFVSSAVYPTLGDPTTGLYQGILGGAAPGTALSQNPYGFMGLTGVIDEPFEVVNDPKYQNAGDQIFTDDEMIGLHLSDTDFKTVLGQSRLQLLASANFHDDNNAAAIRKRFTVRSFDRKQHGFTFNAFRPWEYAAFNNWDGTGGSQFPPMSIGTSLAAQVPVVANSNGNAEPFRMEVSALIGAKANNAQYDVTGASTFPNSFNTPAYDFPSSQSGMDPWHQQFKLDVNRLVTTLDPSQPFTLNALLPMLPNGNPLRFRELTPHPTPAQWAAKGSPFTAIPQVAPTAAPYPSQTSGSSFSSNPVLQEYWARRDRQLLARDIYVMLYMFGGGQDGVNYATTSNASRTLYTDQQLQEMAQFAVNYVDALDRDDTITVFEYDTNLSNGWNLDDNPMTVDASGDRAVVYGVEMQTLVLSEAMFVQHKKTAPGVNMVITAFDDSAANRYFSYIELQNIAPANVHLDSAGTNGNGFWRIQLQSTDVANCPQRNVRIKRDGLNTAGPPYIIAPSGRFVISSVGLDNSQVDMVNATSARGSDLRFSCYDDGTTFDRIAPNVFENPSPGSTTPVIPGANIDLVHERDWVVDNNNTTFTMTDSAGTIVPTRGGFLMGGTGGVGGAQFVITLQRRLNLNRPTPPTTIDSDADNSDNPWITVDRIGTLDSSGLVSTGVPLLVSQIGSGATSATVRTSLATVVSSERKWLLDGTTANLLNCTGSTSQNDPNELPATYTRAQSVQTNPPPPPQYVVMNTLSRMKNSVSPSSNTLWQPHFDRDFSSVMELLSIPLYGPDRLTTALSYNGQLVSEFTSGFSYSPQVRVELANSFLPPSATPTQTYEARVAQAKFFRPQHPWNVGISPITPARMQFDNRWHRILELLEVSSLENLQVDNSLLSSFPWISPHALQRAPGKMNINGTRYAETLFSLLDDPGLFQLPSSTTLPFTPYLVDGSYSDRLEGTNRNWWQQLLNARDGKDPQVSAFLGASVYLPGSTAAQPFQSFSFSARNPANYTLPSTTAYPNSADDTLLRTLPMDPVPITPTSDYPGPTTFPIDQRRLFEARTDNDRDLVPSGVAGAPRVANPTPDTVDYYTRNRILSKIAGNTTNRSNVFIVWITIGSFEGFQDPVNNPGVTQIGSEISTAATRRRGFFIVDRSQLEDAWNPTTGTYDFRKFIQYRKIIQ